MIPIGPRLVVTDRINEKVILYDCSIAYLGRVVLCTYKTIGHKHHGNRIMAIVDADREKMLQGLHTLKQGETAENALIVFRGVMRCREVDGTHLKWTIGKKDRHVAALQAIHAAFQVPGVLEHFLIDLLTVWQTDGADIGPYMSTTDARQAATQQALFTLLQESKLLDGNAHGVRTLLKIAIGLGYKDSALAFCVARCGFDLSQSMDLVKLIAKFVKPKLDLLLELAALACPKE